jgi:hypothetical protein
LLVCLVGLLLPAPALAWGDVGHRIICEIAFQELQPTAREQVKAMIRGPRVRHFRHVLQLARLSPASGDRAPSGVVRAS